MRRFYDMVRMEDVGNWEEKLGYTRIVTAGEWIDISGKKAEARKRARSARNAGKIPVFVADSIEKAKEGSWVDQSIMEIRTRIDMQVARIMRERGVAAMITLDWIRSSITAPQRASDAIRILHKARVPILLATGAKGINELKAPRDVAAVGALLGMSVPMALSAVSSNWEGFL